MSKKHATRNQYIAEVKRIAKLSDGVVTREFFRQHSQYTEKGVYKHFPRFSDLITEAGLTEKAAEVSAADKLEVEKQKIAAKKDDSAKMLTEALKQNERLQKEKSALLDLTDRTPQIFDIPVRTPSTDSESVAIILASDWHSEEEVLSGQVGGLNTHNLDVGMKRANNFWRGAQRLLGIFQKDTKIKTVVLGLLGDFITNSIHEDGAESNLLPPSDAIYRVQNMLLSGIDFLLKNTDSNLHIVCHSGNHGRMTKEQRVSTELGNSIEQFMYYHLRDLLKSEPRVTFQISEGYHSYVRLFEGKYIIRFHHGHGLNYGGGVGGITVPVRKAIAQWNKGQRADLDCFGHFHQYVDAGDFVANGSMIGYNAYALRIKADFEPPTQSFFLVNKRWNRKSIATPIFLD